MIYTQKLSFDLWFRWLEVFLRTVIYLKFELYIIWNKFNTTFLIFFQVTVNSNFVITVTYRSRLDVYAISSV